MAVPFAFCREGSWKYGTSLAARLQRQLGERTTVVSVGDREATASVVSKVGSTQPRALR